MILMLFFIKNKKIGGNFATDEELPTVVRYMSDRRITPPYPERMMNMKRTLKILLCAALTAAICIPVLADVPATSSGRGATSAILSATEHSGETDVTADLLDGNTATAWVRTSAAAPDLSLALSGASVGEIWIRSGYCYNQNYYNSYDRPATVAVTIWYAYGQQSVTYRYTLSDAFLPIFQLFWLEILSRHPSSVYHR